MKLIEKVKHKYALSDQGAHGMIRAILAVSLRRECHFTLVE